MAVTVTACLCMGLAGCGGVDRDTPVEPAPAPAPAGPTEVPEKVKKDPSELGRTEVPVLESTEEPSVDDGQEVLPEPEGSGPEGPEPDVQEPRTGSGRVDLAEQGGFYGAFMEYADGVAAGKSYVVSPSSFRAAVALAAAGADGSTLDGLLGALGFGSMEEAERWYGDVIRSVEEFNAMVENSERTGMPIDGAYRFLCSAWSNSDLTEGFLPEYETYLKTRFGSPARALPGAELGPELTRWAKEATDGLIDLGDPDMRDAELVLANAVYLRANWVNAFEGHATDKDLFHTAEGTDLEMEFMHQQDDFPYAEVDGRRYLAVPMRGDKFFLVRLGGDAFDLRGMLDAVTAMESVKVDLDMPKLDLENMWEGGSLMGYLEAAGAAGAMGGEADFSRMAAWDAYIDTIVQKARLKTDEDGLEAAAVTMVIMDAMSAFDPEEPVRFTMDEPFAFAVCSGDMYACVSGEETPEVLFAGRFTGVR